MYQDESSFSGVQIQDMKSRREKRTKFQKSFEPDFISFLTEGEPKNYKEAMNSLKAPLWYETINNEVESILQNHIWKLVDLPLRNKPIGYKWIFKRKFKIMVLLTNIRHV